MNALKFSGVTVTSGRPACAKHARTTVVRHRQAIAACERHELHAGFSNQVT